MNFLQPPRVRWAIGLLLVIVGAVLFLRHLPRLLVPPLEQVPADFMVYFQAVQRWRMGASPYDPSQVMTYKYSPGLFGGFALLFYGTTSAGEAWLRFKTLSVLAWIVAVFLVWPKRRAKDLVLLVVGLLWAWKGLLEALDFGQLEVLGTAPLLLGFWYARKFPQVSLAAAALLPFLKLPWALASVGIVLYSRPRRLMDFAPAAVIAVLLGIGVPLFLWGGLSAYGDWVTVLKVQPASILVTEPANQSLSAVFGRTTGYAEIGIALGALLLALQAYRVWKRNHATLVETETLTWLALLCLVSPLSWRWASLWFVQLPLIFSDRGKDPQLRTMAGALFVSWLLTQNPVIRFLGLSHWTDLHVGGWIAWQWFGIFVTALMSYRRQTI